MERSAHREAVWDVLRTRAGWGEGELLVPAGPRPGHCAVCRARTRPGYPCCFHCSEHRRLAAGMLADVVVPVSYAVSGTEFARKLWVYKSDVPGREEARVALRALLLGFLHDHGRCAWSAAGMDAPTHVAVVPTGRARPGPHPLRELIEPYLKLKRISLVTRGSDPVWGRELEIGRFEPPDGMAGADVLLVDDTWTTGASVQSAAVALKRGGARRVAAVVLGRHLKPGEQIGLPAAGKADAGGNSSTSCVMCG